ncbi:MAG: hypothetical protein QM737_15645 [Ferruginibacter sp.]
MYKTTHLNKIKPLTQRMKDMLLECHEREMRQMAPHSIYYSQSAKGLVARGLFYAQEYKGGEKPYMGFYITQLGIDYLEQCKKS